MLPEQYRLNTSSDFRTAVRRGRRTGRHQIVVHVQSRSGPAYPVTTRGVRFGLIISKAVGPAVTRHAVARRLRHICGSVRLHVDGDVDIVVRALPGAATATSAELERQLMSGLRKLGAITAMKSAPTAVPVPSVPDGRRS